jgi:CYTH domain-containing protein
MAEEIERKFLVATAPGAGVLGDGAQLRQGYLALDGDVEVRVRLASAAAWLTIKAGSGLARTEVELPLAPSDAEVLWAQTAGRRIEKVRHELAIDGNVIAEIDRYQGDLDGLCTVEVEFGDREQAQAFVPPPWFGRELTGEPGWSNAALAEHGAPSG